MAEPDATKRTVVFFHPDLGIGGAERLVVDAAVGLQERGHKVVIFTSHCDPNHCFEEARDGTLDVRVRGNYLFPASIFSRLTILCAIARQLHLLLHIHLTSELSSLAPTSFVVDQLSAGLPLLQHLAPGVPILFYCHYPDLLLARGRGSWLKRAYRAPFDALEEWSMGFAQAVAVNSEFTKGVVRRTWPSLERHVELRVVHPCVAVDDEDKPAQEVGEIVEWRDEKVVLSINRFERKKDVALAIRAFAAIPEERRQGVRLVIAGGYDPRITENVEYHAELVSLAASLNLESRTAKTVISALASPPEIPVLFLLSVPSNLKAALLRSATLLVYTPSDEHFGIVPLEAMLAGVPVLASNSGGPRETVLDGATGWLRDAGDVPQWTAVMDRALNETSKGMRERMGRAGVERVKGGFDRGTMARRVEAILGDMDCLGVRRPVLSAVLNFLVIGAVFWFGILVARVLFPRS
ncbi:related to mannosyltransferase alg2 [Cephalotrichum gorgonifer]|uniref:Alpha-1,3/1,6-mannosyltransferase ALG2 n=1 Tax=Cephalotrichum gorgonifer TaxID=2041049 RepID=A0AAE8MZC8_9PEZI|nr:related to mannosyltransferase alg2 [Cephalotrichum gorgonifer]